MKVGKLGWYNFCCELRCSGHQYPFTLSLLFPTPGKLEEAVGHFINFVHFSGNPSQTLMLLQQTLPAPIFRVVCQAYALIQQENKAGHMGNAKAAAKNEEDID